VLGGLLRTDGGLAEHIYTGLLLFVLGGLVLLPVVAVVAYRAEWRWSALPVGAVLLLLLLIYRWVRGGWVGWVVGTPLRHIIIYLCAAEILPVLLLISALR
jgi:hypothetical protein